ncbi:MAG: beta-N-acetylhexosaminidase [Fimbriimonas sp.]
MMISLLPTLALPSEGAPPPVAVVPRPAHFRPATGTFPLNAQTKIAVSDATRDLGIQLQGYLSPSSGLPFELSRRTGNNTISLVLDRRLEVLGQEGYRLKVRPDRVEIRGGGAAGVFYGLQTLRQLLPPDAFRRAKTGNVTWALPCLDIEDRPRFSWRGLHLDVARNFMPKESVLKLLDLMALHKLNTFHWHLTDDQGWRIEIKRYPKLTQVGADRKDTMLTYDPPTYTGRPHGGFYTQDDVREVVAYAAALHITVVPEIEMPGHAQAAIAAYPELGNLTTPLEVGTKWGVIENVFNVEDSTISFLQNVLAEVVELFPSKFIHIGGDEVPKKQWKESAAAQAKMKRLGLKDEHELQSWFVRQMDTWLAARGRRLIGWDEILEGGLAPGATVMSWRGVQGGIAAAQAGHDVVMTPTSHLYLDYYQSRDRKNEPHAIGGFVPLETVYGFEPVPAELPVDKTKHVLGAQGNLWTEYIRDFKHVEYMFFPRAAALSEVVWSPRESRDFTDFRRRLDAHLPRLARLDVNYRKP